MRSLIVPVALGAVLLAFPGTSRGQFGGGPPGGFGGGSPGGFSRGGPSADDSFNRMLSSYGGTGDVVDLARVPPDYRERMNRFAQMSGSEPLPTSGTLTRDQYRDQFNRRMEAMRSRFGDRGGFGGGPPGGFGGPPGGFGSSTPPGSPTASVPPGSTPTPYGGAPGGFGQPGGSGPLGGFSGSFGGRSSDPASYLRERDRNGDGKISPEEASDRMRGSFAQYDTNRDGFVDANEVAVYVNERFSRGSSDGRGGPPSFSQGSPPSPGSPTPTPGLPPSFAPQYGQYPGSPPPSGGSPGSPPAEEDRPTVYRYGHLPKEVPTWFGDLDGDQDGQVGLYEWRKAERATKEFVDMDLNGDCYLTAEEWIRYNQLALERKPTADGATDGGRGGSPSFGGRDRGGSSGRPSFGGGPGGFTFSRDRGTSGSPPSFGDRGSRDGNSRDGGRDRSGSPLRDGGSRDSGSRDGGDRRSNPFTGR